MVVAWMLGGCPTADADGDGFEAPADCDDADPAVHPDATEVCDNGLDDNCDGAAPECRTVGQHALATTSMGAVGSGERALLGSSLAALGDLDGDGFDDVIAGAPGDAEGGADAGAAWVLFGSASGFDASRTVRLTGSEGDRAGASVGGGVDVTGDGVPDVLVGAPGVGPRDAAFADAGTGLAAGAVIVVPGPIGVDGVTQIALADQATRVVGDAENDCVGRAFDVADANGDVVADLLVSAVCRGSYHFVHPHGNIAMLVDGPGAAAAFDGPLSGSVAIDSARVRWEGDEDWDRFATSVAWTRDHSGDGARDVAIGAPDYYGADWINLPATGRVLVFDGAGEGSFGTADALATASGGCCGSQRHEAIGTALVSADLDGDGAADLLAGAPRLDDFGVQGGAFALRGVLSGTVDALADAGGADASEPDAATPEPEGDLVWSTNVDFEFDETPRDVVVDSERAWLCLSDGRVQGFDLVEGFRPSAPVEVGMSPSSTSLRTSLADRTGRARKVMSRFSPAHIRSVTRSSTSAPSLRLGPRRLIR